MASHRHQNVTPPKRYHQQNDTIIKTTNRMDELTHFNREGAAHMVDVGEKPVSRRIATAGGRIRMRTETLRKIRDKGHKKGDVLGVARLAGIMAAKKTAELIPLCHPLSLTSVELEFDLEPSPAAIYCRAVVATRDRTGVEMEALTAVQIALLTIYDMCKAVDRGMVLQDIKLLKKSGGRSGTWIDKTAATQITKKKQIVSKITMEQVLAKLPKGPNTKYPADAVIELTFKGRDEDFQKLPRFSPVRAAFGDQRQATVAELVWHVANSLDKDGRIKGIARARKDVGGFVRHKYGELI